MKRVIFQPIFVGRQRVASENTLCELIPGFTTLASLLLLGSLGECCKRLKGSMAVPLTWQLFPYLLLMNRRLIRIRLIILWGNLALPVCNNCNCNDNTHECELKTIKLKLVWHIFILSWW